MSQQTLDARSAASAVRRRARWVVAAGLIGLIAGVGYVLWLPPRYTSSALVLMPSSGSSDDETSTVTVDTAVKIATSETIMAAAGKAVSLTAGETRKRVKIASSNEQLILFEASDQDGEVARKLTRGLVDAFITYQSSANALVTNEAVQTLTARQTDLAKNVQALQGQIDATKARKGEDAPGSNEDRREAQLLSQLQAQQSDVALRLDTVKQQISEAQQPSGGVSGPPPTVVQPATPPTERSPVGSLLLFGPVGLVLGLLLAIAVVLVTARRDRMLRTRDDIADAVGSTVLISTRSRAPRSVPEWSVLLQKYQPGPVEEFAFRQLLRSLVDSTAAAPNGRGRIDHPRSLTVVSLAGDMRALAVGPQLASFMASLGVRTRLFMTAGQDSAAAALWTACYSERKEDVRPNLIAGEVQAGEAADFNIVLAVLDRADPRLRDSAHGGSTLRTESAVLAVASGSATADDLARFAVSLDNLGERIDGIVVADPERTDTTTGRHSVQERSKQVALPIRLSGLPVRASEGRGVARR